MPTVEHPRIRPGVLEEREYQAAIAASALDRNTLVVLPTGLGKTAIALRVIAEYLASHPDPVGPPDGSDPPPGRPARRERPPYGLLPRPDHAHRGGPPERRVDLLHPPQVVVATPQVVANDLADGAFPLSTFSLIVFDEAHRAVGDYPYVAIGLANQNGPGPGCSP